MTVDDSATRQPAAIVAVAIAAPVGLAALAYALWQVSDRLIVIGPLDRAAFGWFVVVPVWIAVPIVAGLAWCRLTRRAALAVAGMVAAVIGVTAAAVFWQAVSNPSCEFGSIHAPAEWVLPSLVVGGLIGGGVAVSGLVVAKFAADGRAWRAVIAGTGVELAMLVVSLVVAAGLLLGPGCQRPPI